MVRVQTLWFNIATINKCLAWYVATATKLKVVSFLEFESKWKLQQRKFVKERHLNLL